MKQQDINYNTAIAVKSVPMFPKGINRNINVTRGFESTDNPLISGESNEPPAGTTEPLKDTAGNLINADGKRINEDGSIFVDNNANNNTPTAIDFTTDTFTLTEEGLKNTKGEVIKTLEDLEKEGYVAENGDIIDPTSKEVKIKFEEGSNQPASTSTIEDIQKLTGYVIKDEQGKPKVYEDSEKGIAEYSIDLGKELGKQYAKTEQDEFFTSMPDVAAYARHLAGGGTRESFFNYAPKDYSTIELGSLDAEQKANLIYDDYRATGLTETRARALVEAHKKANEIDALAEEALTALKDRKAKFDTEEKTKVETARTKEIEDNKKYWKTLQDTVNSGKLGNLIVPESDKAAFLDYISKPVDNNGLTQHTIDSSKEDINVQLQLAYWRHKGYNFNTMVANLVKQEQALSLKERMKAKNNTASNNVREAKPNAGNNSSTVPSAGNLQ